MTWYDIWLAIHVFGSVLLIGALVTTALWKGLLDRSGDPRQALTGSQGVIQADWAFLVPGFATTMLSGIVLTVMQGWDVRSNWWLMFGMVFLVTAFALWLFVLLPRQRAMLEIARRSQGGRLDAAYPALARTWAIVGGIATFLPVVALFLMILKPF